MAAPAQSGSNTTKLLWAMPSQILYTSMGRDLITSLGKLFQDWNTLMKTVLSILSTQQVFLVSPHGNFG